MVLMEPESTQLIDSTLFKDLSDAIPTFKFEASYEDKPTLLGLCLVLGKTAYTYEFTIKDGIILS